MHHVPTINPAVSERPCFFVGLGVFWKGNTVLRGGKTVTCGHRHRSRALAQVCVDRMRVNRPGKCQDYRVAEIESVRR